MHGVFHRKCAHAAHTTEQLEAEVARLKLEVELLRKSCERFQELYGGKKNTTLSESASFGSEIRLVTAVHEAGFFRCYAEGVLAGQIGR